MSAQERGFEESRCADGSPHGEEARLDVEGGDGLYFLVDPTTRDIRGTLVDLGGGWWRCRTPRGQKRELFVPAHVAEPWRDAAERMGGS
ncbi:hypothetical protein [Actinomadura roseirufa]|uniref:hypothetical protein n=1 Tax=Actinomadura roseirufa TaxID=2094049 RepID=UPI0010411887|nr:hypothetical protein [Actinomadura roseirufa]